MTSRYAKVAIESPLPQLDRLFDYRVPAELLDSCAVGVRVRVPFGKGGALHDGFVIDIVDTSEFAAADIAEVVSTARVLPPEHYRFLRAVADRQAGTLSELLKLAVPKRSVRVEKTWLSGTVDSSEHFSQSLTFPGKPDSFAGRLTALAEPRLVSCSFQGESVALNQHLALQGWVALFVSAALEKLTQGKSSIIVVPDFRDQERIRRAFEQLGLGGVVTDFATDQVGSARYASYLRCLSDQPSVVIGSRSAIYAPISNLGAILVWDDVDQSLHEPTAPYIHAREVALLRQQLSECDLLLAGHSRSAEVQRLLEIGYLKDSSARFAPPRIAVTEPGLRVDSTSYQAVKSALDAGGSVLVQVAATGHSVSTYCAACGERSQCGTCHGPLFIDDKGTPRCRWCSALNLNARCVACGAIKLRQGAAGSTRTASELAKSFPGVAVVEATFAKRVTHLAAGKRMVVATPGAEPVVDGGYSAVILLDGQKLLARDTLRATEQAIDLWSNAVSLLAPNGQAVGVGLASPIGQKFALWDQQGLAVEELANRKELNFPPHHRLASVTGPRQLVDAVVKDLAGQVSAIKVGSLEILGPLAIEQEPGAARNPVQVTEQLWRYLVRFDYSLGEVLASELKARGLKVNVGNKSVNAKSGRSSRAVRIKMDDSEVI